MTTSYDSESTESTIPEGMPSYNAQGMEVWDPAVGLYFKPGANKGESFGGIVTAFQDLQVRNGAVPKAYPENFAGIISAIQDLTMSQLEPPVYPGPNPGNGQIIIDADGNPEWNITSPLPDGSLWFDTRQGRLFVSLEDQWYQSNGADGLAIVTNNEVSPEVQHPVAGQFWWDSANNNLFIFDGLFQLPNGGGITDNPLVGGSPIWKLVTDGLVEAFQTTLTLPLGLIGPAILNNNEFNILPTPDPSTFKVQADFNVWTYESFKLLDEFLDETTIQMGEAYVGTPKAGDLWYDPQALELSIWYVDDDAGQWVPVSASYSFDTQISELNEKISAETDERLAALIELDNEIIRLKGERIPDLTPIENRVTQLESHVDNHPVDIDITLYATKSALETAVTTLETTLNAVSASVPSAGSYATAAEVQQLQTAIDALPTTAEVTASIDEKVPSVSSFVTQANINTAISNITTDYLPTTGGTLNGSFVVNRTDMSAPAFDFSAEKWYSYNTHKYRTNSTATNYAHFGTNIKPWEYEWEFKSNEDFCWVYNDTNKVFSITKDGPACSQLYLADFQPNDSNGRVLHNTIDVKDRLVKYQSAFETIRTKVFESTDFDTLKANLLTALASV